LWYKLRKTSHRGTEAQREEGEGEGSLTLIFSKKDIITPIKNSPKSPHFTEKAPDL
jgi:hypothetical protein